MSYFIQLLCHWSETEITILKPEEAGLGKIKYKQQMKQAWQIPLMELVSGKKEVLDLIKILVILLALIAHHVFFCTCGSLQGHKLLTLKSWWRSHLYYNGNNHEKKLGSQQKNLELSIKTCSVNIPLDTGSFLSFKEAYICDYSISQNHYVVFSFVGAKSSVWRNRNKF